MAIQLAWIRAFDVIVSSLLLIFFAPLLLLLMVLVRLSSPGPIFFAQRRIGRGGVEFDCLKFRSMVVDAADRLQQLLATNPDARREWAMDHKLKHDPRVTWIGRFLRKSSLDELPQLLNVLRNEMSLVGPRPIVVGEIHRYGRYLPAYFSVKPGITGLWQISGRSNTSYRRRVAIDVVYSRSKSVKLDLRILVATLPVVMFQRGSY